MFTHNIVLDTIKVAEIKGKFFIPSYQRGYRWGEDDVIRLLNDVYQNGENSYCLQPIVVKRKEDKSLEVVDGQQRLTTIFLIYKYLNNVLPFSPHPLFSIAYETRDKSQEFLEEIDQSNDTKYTENIDFYFMKRAYDAIKDWFADEKHEHDPQTLKTYFENYVQVIWYEVDNKEDPISLFARLNIGKIPLTSAELVKAMFLSKSHELYSGVSENSLPDLTKQEIALQWDMIEQELHNESFWYFLSNSCSSNYSTKIELLLDLIADKKPNERDKYFTFFKFDSHTCSLAKLWLEIQNAFWMLKDWYEDHELYHKIGYLIYTQEKSLQDIFKLAKDKTKKEFLSKLNDAIKKSIRITQNDPNTLQDYAELSYEKIEDCKKIIRLLLLFNVESVRKLAEQSQRFPFDKFKFNKKNKVVWSLEHIHAQHSKGLVDIKAWHSWVSEHILSIKTVAPKNVELIERMKKAVENPKLSGVEFEEIRTKVVNILNGPGKMENMHSLANMALLNVADNAALNNAAFDVKRNIVIKLIREGNYIPFCTQMVFLKSYTPAKDTQIHFWGEKDRKAYIVAMHKILKPYLK